MQRFRDARAAGQPEPELLRHLNEAAGRYHEALDLLPPDAVNDLAASHNSLGAIYGDAGDLDLALPNYQRAISLHEQAGDLYRAAESRRNLAIDLLSANRRPDALQYAEAALRGFESYGERAAEESERTRRLIAAIRGG